MHVQPVGNTQVSVTVESNESKNEQPVYLFVQNRGIPKIDAVTVFNNGRASFLIDKNRLGEGIAQFTVLNGAGLPMCERVYFIYPENKMAISVTTDKPVYNSRSLVNMQLSARDTLNLPLASNLSVAVYRLDSLPWTAPATICDYLLLSSDLAGNVESPGFYFSDRTEKTEEAMDNLMLTQGWRRFQWKDVLNKTMNLPEFAPETNGHLITGKIMNYRTGAKEAYMAGYASLPGKRTQFRTSESDSNGVIRFEMPDFSGNSSVVVQTNTVRDSLYSIDVANPFSNKYSTASAGTPYSAPIPPGSMKDIYLNAQIENVFRGDSLNRWKLQAVDTSYFYGKADERYMLDDYTRFTTMEEVMREFVMSVNVFKKGGKLNLVVLNTPARKFFTAPPLVLIDGVPFFDINKVMHVDPLKIKKIELITKEYFFESQDFSGIVNCVTYKGDLDGIDLDAHAAVLNYEGLQLERVFYSPAYETTQSVNSRLPDFRNVLYWMPDAGTDESGKKQLHFYTSDLPGKYAIVVQGLSSQGLPAASTAYFTVRP